MLVLLQYQLLETRLFREKSGIFSGKTVYPDEFSQYLVKSYCWYTFIQGKEAKKQGLDFAIKAFQIGQSQAPMRQILFAARFPELRPQAEAFCKSYFDEFAEKRELWSKQHGYHHRIAAVLNVGSYFRELARRQKKQELVQSYQATMNKYHNERRQLLRNKRW